MKELTLLSNNTKPIVLRLSEAKKTYTIEEILNVQNKVYSDVRYSIKLDSDQDIKKVDVYVNGENVSSTYYEGIIQILDEDKKFLFEDSLGMIQISLAVLYLNNVQEWYYSEYASVLVKSDNKGKAIKPILKYIYENQDEYLRQEAISTQSGIHDNNRYEDFHSQIIMLEEIVNIYESSYGFFMANCRNKLERVEILDRVDKLQEISSKTIQYIANHPEYLQNSVSGIKYGSRYFLPTKTMMMQKRFTNDIYENRVVMSFLEHIHDYIRVLMAKIQSYLQMIPFENESEDGYIVSTYILYLNANEVLKGYCDKLEFLENHFETLIYSYKQILNVGRVPMIKRPDATAIFMNLPQYKKIYLCILKWLDKTGYDLTNEQVLLSFVDAPAIYESYTLIKLVNFVKEMGFRLVESKKVVYPKSAKWKYKNRSFNNTYIFEDNESRFTLYYEPIIYNKDMYSINQLALYRNNSVSLSKDSEEERNGHYYVPDYVLKYEKNNYERYLICDAKFSPKNTVRYTKIPELAFKYLTSISTTKVDARIAGLCVFYGINDSNDIMESFFDRKLENGQSIIPEIELFPLSENSTGTVQMQNAKEMLRYLFDDID